ncbi:MAG: hypothetical protein ACE5I4_04485 [Thermoplasmata archaeon]
MEQPLQTLFLQDLRSDARVRFRPRVFYAVFAVGFVSVYLESVFLASNLVFLQYFGALPNPFYQWIAWGLIAALLSFKWDTAESAAHTA